MKNYTPANIPNYFSKIYEKFLNEHNFYYQKIHFYLSLLYLLKGRVTAQIVSLSDKWKRGNLL